MLKDLLKGVSMGTGMGIGQELTGTIIQNVMNKRSGNNFGDSNTAIKPGDRDIRCICGKINTGDSKFCGECGNAVVTRCILTSGVKCVCGYINAQGQKFCSECGSRLV
jgi:membrane protease subunit (stomatin/prohibitin family)